MNETKETKLRERLISTEAEVWKLEAEVERLRTENRALQDVIDEAHGELDYLSPSTNGLEHGLWERLVAIRDQETA